MRKDRKSSVLFSPAPFTVTKLCSRKSLRIQVLPTDWFSQHSLRVKTSINAVVLIEFHVRRECPYLSRQESVEMGSFISSEGRCHLCLCRRDFRACLWSQPTENSGVNLTRSGYTTFKVMYRQQGHGGAIGSVWPCLPHFQGQRNGSGRAHMVHQDLIINKSPFRSSFLANTAHILYYKVGR